MPSFSHLEACFSRKTLNFGVEGVGLEPPALAQSTSPRRHLSQLEESRRRHPLHLHSFSTSKSLLPWQKPRKTPRKTKENHRFPPFLAPFLLIFPLGSTLTKAPAAGRHQGGAEPLAQRVHGARAAGGGGLRQPLRAQRAVDAAGADKVKKGHGRCLI